MRSSQRYILLAAVTYAATILALSLNNVTLDLYISVFIIEYFTLTLLHSPFSPATQKITNMVSYVLFTVFLAIVSIKVLEILGVSML